MYLPRDELDLQKHVEDHVEQGHLPCRRDAQGRNRYFCPWQTCMTAVYSDKGTCKRSHILSHVRKHGAVLGDTGIAMEISAGREELGADAKMESCDHGEAVTAVVDGNLSVPVDDVKPMATPVVPASVLVPARRRWYPSLNKDKMKLSSIMN